MTYAERKNKNPEKFLAYRRMAAAKYRAADILASNRKSRESYARCAVQRRADARQWAADNAARVTVTKRDLRRRKADTIQMAKARPCADCGNRYPPYVMDLDHVRGKKIANVSAMTVSFSFARILIEIAKCDVVCANCHRERTAKRKRGVFVP